MKTKHHFTIKDPKGKELYASDNSQLASHNRGFKTKRQAVSKGKEMISVLKIKGTVTPK